jgi:hypothetical protein
MPKPFSLKENGLLKSFRNRSVSRTAIYQHGA